MLQNFTVIDVIASVEACLFLTLILPIPGYVIGWASNAFSFRQQRFGIQLLLSTPLAVSALPIFAYFVGRYRTLLWILLGLAWVGFALMVRRRVVQWVQSGRSKPSRAASWTCTVVAIWALLAIASLVDLQLGRRLYFSVPAYDYSLRTAVTAAASRAIPPANPFFANVPPVLLRYHYFWMLICSLVPRVASIGPRQAMCGGTVWAGIALISLIGIGLKFFLRVREHFARTFFIGCGLLLVTGLDIVPTIFLYFSQHVVYPDMEWWNEQLTSWPDALLWCPHHVMSLVACFTGFLLVRQPFSTRAQRWNAIVLAGIAFASAVGLSVLVSFTFAVFVAFWLPYAALRRWWDEVAQLVSAGTLALFLALPFLKSLLGPAIDGSGGDGRFFAIWIRPFKLGMTIVASHFHIRGTTLGLLALPFLPLSYFLELGFFAVIAAIRLRNIRKQKLTMTREEAAAWMMVAVSFLIGSFARSTSIQSNDLGWRCFLQAQMIFLLWAACSLDEWWQYRRLDSATVRFAAIFLVLGFAGSLYQFSMLRMYPILLDYGKVHADTSDWIDTDHQLGERTYALRSIYDQLSKRLPSEAVVQYNPNATTLTSHGLYSLHDAAVGLPLCGAVFGGSVSRCQSRTDALTRLFAHPTAESNAAFDSVCREYGISTVLVDDSDPVWTQQDSWVWTRAPALANGRVRAFSCGHLDQQAKVTAETKQ